jgi:hypothetical protein
MQWLLVHNLDTVFIQATMPTVLPVIDFSPSAIRSTQFGGLQNNDVKSEKCLYLFFVLQLICRVRNLLGIHPRKQLAKISKIARLTTLVL